jgi:hypothetical protein
LVHLRDPGPQPDGGQQIHKKERDNISLGISVFPLTSAGQWRFLSLTPAPPSRENFLDSGFQLPEGGRILVGAVQPEIWP